MKSFFKAKPLLQLVGYICSFHQQLGYFLVIFTNSLTKSRQYLVMPMPKAETCPKTSKLKNINTRLRSYSPTVYNMYNMAHLIPDVPFQR